MKKIVIYPGRFQPFGPHHFKAYKWLCQVFGIDSVFIVTSNKTDLNSPLTFEEKKLCIQKYNINPEKIVQVVNPYKADEIISRFNPNETSVIFAYGEKDFGRIRFQKSDGSESYFKQYYGQNELKPLSECGYVVEMPNFSIKFQGKEINGTLLRQALPMAKHDEFENLMGYYDAQIHFLFKRKFHPDITNLAESVLLTEGDITRTQLQRIEQYADRLFKEYGIDIEFQNLMKGTHFWHRVNDPRNGKPISTDELRQIFKKASIKFGEKLQKSPTGLEAVLRDMETDINLPFILKYDYKNKELDLVPKTIMRKKDFKSSTPFLTMEAKKFTKHICHLYEDKNLTIDDYLDFVDALLVNTDKIGKVSLKYDGHNFKVTFRNGRILCAQNKSSIIEPLTMLQLKEKYKDKPNPKMVYSKVLEEIGQQLLRLGTQQLNQIFNNGRTFLNFEILHPKIVNVFEYDEPTLSLHSLITYDENGNEIHQTTEIPFNLGNGKIFKIQKSPHFKLEPLNDPATVKFIKDKIVSGIDLKETVLLLENLVIQNFCKTNPQNSKNKTVIGNIVSNVQSNLKTDADISKFKEGLRLLDWIGGVNAINPIEGLVFEYRGNVWKCTGSFGALQPIFNIYNKMRFPKK
jgi:hypothetical protein